MNKPMHWKRWLTVLVLVPILIVIIFKGGTFLFAVLTILVGLICLWEYFAIAFKDSSQPVPLFYSLWAYLTGSLILAAAAYVSWPGIVGAFIANVIGVAFFSVFHFRHSVQAPLDAVKQIFGLVYISLMLSFAILIRAGDQGPKWIFFVVWVIAWGDSGAFYVGSYFGRHKLCPSVSPKKTIEGAVGGLAANLIFGVIYKIVFLNSLSMGGCLLFSLTIGIVGQVGDLFESEFKRAAGVKDSSKLLPGHGGFLDRIDALLLAIPVAYFLKEHLLT